MYNVTYHEPCKISLITQLDCPCRVDVGTTLKPRRVGGLQYFSLLGCCIVAAIRLVMDDLG